jgi:hypothetical protein
MRRRWFAVAGLLAACAPLAALQGQRPLSLAVGGGVSLPQGGWSDGVTSAGWNALAALVLSTHMQPLGLRLDAAYDQFAYSDAAQTALGGAGNQSMISGTLNVTYRLPAAGSPMSPYLISGLGAYHGRCSRGPACDGATRYGWNVGLGTKLHLVGVRSFLEARYHRTERAGRDVNFFPITLGLML